MTSGRDININIDRGEVIELKLTDSGTATGTSGGIISRWAYADRKGVTADSQLGSKWHLTA